ncbi:glycosyl hydrolase family 18 protein [Elizabethkingia ursingii]
MKKVTLTFPVLEYSEFKNFSGTIPEIALFDGKNKNAKLPLVVGYFPSWSDYSTRILRNIPEEVTYVFLSFVKPNMRYKKGSFDLTETGLQCDNNGMVLKETVDILKSRGIGIILSIGGETYWGSDDAYDINHQQIADFVRDFGFEGIDWDYEPNGSFATIGEPINVQRFISMIEESRKLLPKEEGYIIACAPSGVGALGGLTNDDPESPYAYSKRGQLTGESDTHLYQPTSPAGHSIPLFGFGATGHMIPVMKAVGHHLDFIAFQGYNVGSATRRELMYDSYAYYANIYGFKVAFGMHVPNEPWGPFYKYSEDKIKEYTSHVAEGGKHNRFGKGDGVMYWQLLQKSADNSAIDGIDYSKISYNILDNANPVTSPSISVSSPVNNTLIKEGNNFDFSVNTKRTNFVKFYIDNQLIETLHTEPFKITIKQNQLSRGYHILKAIASGTTGEEDTAFVTIKIISNDSVEGIPQWEPRIYSSADNQVLHNNKVWSNKWYAEASDIPGLADVWKLIQNTDNDGEGPVVSAPSAPSGIFSPIQTTNSITITWLPSTGSNPIDFYTIYRNGIQLLDKINDTEFTDINLHSNKEYSYQIKATDTANNSSSISNSIIVKTKEDNGNGFLYWEKNKWYADNDIVKFEAINYICLMQHTSNKFWSPDKATSLWAKYGL